MNYTQIRGRTYYGTLTFEEARMVDRTMGPDAEGSRMTMPIDWTDSTDLRVMVISSRGEPVLTPWLSDGTWRSADPIWLRLWRKLTPWKLHRWTYYVQGRRLLNVREQ